MKQLIRLTENDLHRIVEGAVREIFSEYGTPGQLGAIAARRTFRGKGDSKEPLKYANDRGIMNQSFYDGYVEYMKYHPEEVDKYAREKFHQNKNKKGA